MSAQHDLHPDLGPVPKPGASEERLLPVSSGIGRGPPSVNGVGLEGA